MRIVAKALLLAFIWFAVVMVGIPWLVFLAGESPRVQSVFQQCGHILGGVFAVGGVFLSLSCVIVFMLKGKGTPAPFDPPQQFVVIGPYRWTRNPMMLGNIIALIGYALFFESFAILIYAIVFWLIGHLALVFYEEPGLFRRFGSEYEEYFKTTPRWLPQIFKRG